MAESKADLILHPIRMRMIQALASGRMMTTLQLAERMADIPQATMYRHLNKLLKAGLIEVAETRKVRGTVEKVYALAANGADAGTDDLTETSSASHMELFLKFLASLIGEFGAYVGQKQYHLLEDGVSFRQVELYLTDEEYMQLLKDMREPMQRHVGNSPGDGRRRRMISTIVIPETSKGDHDHEQHD